MRVADIEFSAYSCAESSPPWCLDERERNWSATDTVQQFLDVCRVVAEQKLARPAIFTPNFLMQFGEEPPNHFHAMVWDKFFEEAWPAVRCPQVGIICRCRHRLTTRHIMIISDAVELCDGNRRAHIGIPILSLCAAKASKRACLLPAWCRFGVEVSSVTKTHPQASSGRFGDGACPNLPFGLFVDCPLGLAVVWP